MHGMLAYSGHGAEFDPKEVLGRSQGTTVLLGRSQGPRAYEPAGDCRAEKAHHVQGYLAHKKTPTPLGPA